MLYLLRWYGVFDNEETEDTPPVTPPAEKLLTQAQFDKALQERLAREAKKTEALRTQLEQLGEIKAANNEETEKLKAALDKMTSELLTKEQIAAKAKQKAEEELTNKLKQKEVEADQWKSKYTDSTIQRSLVDAAVSNEAFNPEQIVVMLKGQSFLDEDGPRVKLPGKNESGESVELVFTPDEAVKHIKDQTDKYGNLFKSGLNGGIGGANDPGIGSGKVDFSTHEAYMKNRARILK